MFSYLDIAGIYVLHASSVFNRDGALIFLGPSGIGKSTICGLLSPYMSVLAEDKIYLVPMAEGQWDIIGDGSRLRGISGKDDLLRLPRVPLRAIFRLYQTGKPVLQRLDTLSVCRHLIDAYFEIGGQRDLSLTNQKYAFSGLGKIARALPGYAFHFDLSLQTLDLLNREMGLW